MNILIYAGIFIFKMIEEALRTLHIIVVSNGKKWLGAIVQFFVAIIWIVVTGTVIVGIKEDPLKVLFYALGSLIGSYLGSVLEEKIALGYVVLMVEVDDKLSKLIVKRLKKARYTINSVRGGQEDMEMLMITAPRKKTDDVIKIIRSFDENVEIVTEKVKIVASRL